jgi:glycosyltransferase involved in cell wall biosynthesis
VSNDARALIRVFVPTYRRNAVLPRAISSLRMQTFTNWVCEIHNDDPSDSFPAQLVKHLADSRIELHQHEKNLGAVVTFNLFYRPITESFFAVLEDDNWWEPKFLATMLRKLTAHPDSTLAWCNQKVWEELPDGSWRNTGQLVNRPEKSEERLVEFGNVRQIMAGMHGHGAALFRSHADRAYQTPVDWPLDAIEPLRERMTPHPLLYVSEPLAIIGATLQTARPENRAEWAIVQTMLAATFLKHARYGDSRLADFFASARARRRSSPLIFAGLVEPSCRNLLRFSRARDWLLLLRIVIRRPFVLWGVLRSRRRHKDWWQLVEQHTVARFEELRLREARLRQAARIT